MAYVGVEPTRLLMEGMRVAQLNHRYLAQNIANAETPNYTPGNIDFQGTLRSTLEGREGFALRTGHSRHVEFTQHRPQFKSIASLSKNDYNKVDLDDQIAKLNENTGRYATYSRLLARRFSQMREVINELRR